MSEQDKTTGWSGTYKDPFHAVARRETATKTFIGDTIIDEGGLGGKDELLMIIMLIRTYPL